MRRCMADSMPTHRVVLGCTDPCASRWSERVGRCLHQSMRSARPTSGGTVPQIIVRGGTCAPMDPASATTTAVLHASCVKYRRVRNSPAWPPRAPHRIRGPRSQVGDLNAPVQTAQTKKLIPAPLGAESRSCAIAGGRHSECFEWVNAPTPSHVLRPCAAIFDAHVGPGILPRRRDWSVNEQNVYAPRTTPSPFRPRVFPAAQLSCP
jgi:hypothetical protein